MVFLQPISCMAGRLKGARRPSRRSVCPQLALGWRLMIDARWVSHRAFQDGIKRTFSGYQTGGDAGRMLVDQLWRVARVRPINQELLDRLAKEIGDCSTELSPANLADVACALTIGGVRDCDVFFKIADAAASRLDELPLGTDRDDNTASLKGLLWSFTEVKVVHEGLMFAMAQQAKQRLSSFVPSVLSDVREVCFWGNFRYINEGFGKVGFALPEFFNVFAPMATQHIKEFPPISCVYLMWSFSKAGIRNGELFDAIANYVNPMVETLDRCGAAMHVRNFAYASNANPEVYQAVADDTLRTARMIEIAPRDISAITWAFAKMRKRHDELFTALSQHSVMLLEECMGQETYRSPERNKRKKKSGLFRQIYIDRNDNSSVNGACDAFDMMSLAEILEAYAKSKVASPSLFEHAGNYMAEGLGQSLQPAKRFLRYPRALLRVLRAYDELQVEHYALFRAAAPHSKRILDSGNYGSRDGVLLARTLQCSSQIEPGP